VGMTRRLSPGAVVPVQTGRATSGLQQYIDGCRARVLEEIRNLVPVDSPYSGVLYQHMFDYILRDAKMLRPAICIATCRWFGAGLDPAFPPAAVLELYHNAFLIHDDVEDGPEIRRGLPTLHERYGIPIAMNVGDAMLALALQPLLDNMWTIGMGKAL